MQLNLSLYVLQILAKHSHFFDGKANTEPHKSHRMALRKAFLQLCSKPNAGTKRGLTHCIRQLIHKLAPRSVWVQYCLKGHSPRKRSMEDELHRFVRIIMVVVMKIWGVDENVASTHLAEALRKESDRAGFRLTPRAKKTRGGRNGEPNAVTDNIRDDIAIASNSTDTTISRGSPSNLDKGPCDSDGDVDSIVANSDSDRSGVSDANSTLFGSDDE